MADTVKNTPPSGQPIRRIAIQGERGSNSHMASLAMLGDDIEVVPCELSADLFQAVLNGDVDAAVLPIENSLHGSVAEHYDLFLTHPVRLDRESLLRIRHNLIAAPGVTLEDITSVLSHPVALSQCRRFLNDLTANQATRALPFYDTAGSVKHVMANNLRDTAGVAPELAAKEYGAHILVPGIEDHTENYTRFHLVRCVSDPTSHNGLTPNKLTVAFALEHRPGTLVAALTALATASVDLTKIESRPVPGRPWEYIFYADFRFPSEAAADQALTGLRLHSSMVKEIGRYPEA